MPMGNLEANLWWHKKEDVINLNRFKERTGMHKSHIHRTLTKLYLRRIITRSGKKYGFQKDYDQWIEPISYFFTNLGNIYFKTRKDRFFKCSCSKVTHIGKKEWSKYCLKHKKVANSSNQKVTQTGNGVTRSGKSVTQTGKNQSLQLRTDKSTRTPKETLSKETIIKEKNKTFMLGKTKYIFSDEDIKLATLLHNIILDRDSTYKWPGNNLIERWANDVRLMRERDNRSSKEIEDLIIWSQDSSFWRSNIESITKLRKKFSFLKDRKKSEEEKDARGKTPKERLRRNSKEGWEEKPKYKHLYE